MVHISFISYLINSTSFINVTFCLVFILFKNLLICLTFLFGLRYKHILSIDYGSWSKIKFIWLNFRNTLDNRLPNISSMWSYRFSLNLDSSLGFHRLNIVRSITPSNAVNNDANISSKLWWILTYGSIKRDLNKRLWTYLL